MPTTLALRIDTAKVQRARLAKGYNYSELARVVGLTPAQVRAVALGRSAGSPASVAAIAAALDLSVDDVYLNLDSTLRNPA